MTGVRDRITSVKNRQGALKTLKIPSVCKRCNSEWMSGLEEQVRPWLEPMIQDHEADLTPDAQKTLAQYFMMKSMVADQGRRGYEYFTEDELDAFYRNRVISPTTSIVVWRCNAELDPRVKGYLREAVLPDSPGTDVSYYPASFTFVMGAVFVQLVSFRKLKSDVQYDAASGFMIFPPNNETLHWPPPIPINAGQAQRLQMVFTRARAE